MVQNRRAWTGAIRPQCGQVSVPESARQLNRSEAATRIRASKLGIKTAVIGAEISRSPVKRAVSQPAEVLEKVVAPVAIERALSIYQRLQERDQSVLLQARKILTQHIYGLVDQGEKDEQRLTVGGLVHLKAIERDHAIKSAHAGPSKSQRGKATA